LASSRAPRVSIGLPVFNGAAGISKSIEQLLTQDFADFELIISDNASTDATPDLCASFARLDDRILFKRQPNNMGSAANFDWVATKASGEFFMWAAHDDYHDRSFIKKCAAALDRKEAVLAVPDFVMRRPDGRVAASYCYPDEISHPDVVRRLRWLLRAGVWMAIYGLIRRSALIRTRPMTALGSVPAPGLGSDYRLVELVMLGPLVRVPEPLFEYCVHQRTFDDLVASISPDSLLRGTMSWWWIRDVWRIGGRHGFDFASRIQIERECWASIRSRESTLRGVLLGYNANLRRIARHEARWSYLGVLYLEWLLLHSFMLK
jgi:glycosyltransferase involved in cell wall biosynthesis